MTLHIRDNGSWYVDIAIENALSDLITHHFLKALEYEFDKERVRTALLWRIARKQIGNPMEVSDEVRVIARCIDAMMMTDISDG